MLLVEATVQASGLGFPEGPLVLPGRTASRSWRSTTAACRSSRRAVRTLAQVGGNPNGLALGADGLIYVTRGRGAVGAWLAPGAGGAGDRRRRPADGSWEVVTTTASRAPAPGAQRPVLRARRRALLHRPGRLRSGRRPPRLDLSHGPDGHRAAPRARQHLPQRPRLRSYRPSGVDGVAHEARRRCHRRRRLGGPRAARRRRRPRTAVPTRATVGSSWPRCSRAGLDVIDLGAGRTIASTGSPGPTAWCPPTAASRATAIWVTDVRTDWDTAHDTGKLWRLETT